jgi:FSR family fosmidomycin resistance protein-like MFS transporter
MKRNLDAYTARRTILTAPLILHSRPDTMTTTDASTEDGKQAGLSLAVCCSVHAMQDGLTTTVNVLLPILAQAFGLSYAQVGVVKAANVAAMALLEIPSGLLSERFGARILLAFGLLIVGVGYLWLSLAAGFTAILFSLLLAGVGAAFQHTLSSAIISAAFPGPACRPALGTYNASGDVGKLALSGIFTLSIGLGFGWQTISRGYGLVSIALAVLVLILLFRRRIGGRPRCATPASSTEVRRSGWGIRSKTAFSGLCAITFLDTMAQSGFLTFVAFLMIEKGVAVNLAALAVVLTLAGGVVGKFCCGFLAKHMGIIRSLALVELLTAAGIVAVVIAPPMAAFSLLPILGAFLQGSSSITYGTISDMFHQNRQARGFSLIYTTANISSVTASITLGLISDQFGLSVMMLTMAALTLVTLPLCALLRTETARPIGLDQ